MRACVCLEVLVRTCELVEMMCKRDRSSYIANIVPVGAVGVFQVQAKESEQISCTEAEQFERVTPRRTQHAPCTSDKGHAAPNGPHAGRAV